MGRDEETRFEVEQRNEAGSGPIVTSPNGAGGCSAFPRTAEPKSGQLMCYQNRTTSKATDTASNSREASRMGGARKRFLRAELHRHVRADAARRCRRHGRDHRRIEREPQVRRAEPLDGIGAGTAGRAGRPARPRLRHRRLELRRLHHRRVHHRTSPLQPERTNGGCRHRTRGRPDLDAAGGIPLHAFPAQGRDGCPDTG